MSRLSTTISLAVLAAAGVSPAAIGAQQVLVYCPPGSAAGGISEECSNTKTAITRAGYTPVEAHGSGRTVNLTDAATAEGDLKQYAAIVITSATSYSQYDVLRTQATDAVKRALRKGNIVLFSGRPDNGNSGRTEKDALIKRLVDVAKNGHTTANGRTGVVILLDGFAETETGTPRRFDWVNTVTGAQVSARYLTNDLTANNGWRHFETASPSATANDIFSSTLTNSLGAQGGFVFPTGSSVVQHAIGKRNGGTPETGTILATFAAGGARNMLDQTAVQVTGPASGTVGQKLAITTSGGSGTGALSFTATGGRCSIVTTGADAGKLEITSGTGTCSVTATKAADGLYNAATSAAFAVTVAGKANQAITFAQPTTPAAYNSTFTVAPTTDATGLTVSVAASGGCSISGGTVTMTSGSTACTLTATQTGNADYNAAEQVVHTVAAGKANQATALTVTAPTSGSFGDKLVPAAEGGDGTGAISFTAAGACAIGTGADAGKVVITAGTGSCSVTATKAGDNNYNLATSAASTFTPAKAAQAITWATPAAITYGTALSATQLNANRTTGDGALTYTPGAGTTLDVGPHTLSVTAAATDNYAAATKTVSLTVNKAGQATLTVTGMPTAAQPFGGTFTVGTSGGSGDGAVTYTAAGACTNAGNAVTMSAGTGTCSVTATKAASTNFTETTSAAATVAAIKAAQAALSVTGMPTADQPFGATFTVGASGGTTSGAVTYTAAGACTNVGSAVTMRSGTGTCSVTATMAGDARYNDVTSAAATVAAKKADQNISWADPAAITYGTALSTTQLNASALGGATLTYSPAAGMVLGAGTRTLTVNAAATDNYDAATKTVSLTVNKADQAISWTAPAAITYGTTLSATQLNASTSGNGQLTYDPAAGAELGAGTHTLSVRAAETDNYRSATGTVSLTVNKADQAALTLAGVPSSAAFNSTFNVTAGGGSSSAARLVAASGGCSLSGSTVTMTSGTTACTVTVNRDGDNNYNAATQVSASATAQKIDQPTAVTVSAPASMTFGQLAATLTAGGGNGTGTYSFSAGSSTGCSIASGNQLSVTNAANTCTVTASRAGDDNYNGPATSASSTVTLVKANQTITFTQPTTPALFGSTFAVAPTTSAAGLTVSVAATAGGACSIANGTVTMTSGTGDCALTATQAGSDNYNAAANVVRTVAAQRAPQVIAWTAPAPITYSTALSTTQLNASVTTGDGALTYTPAAGTVLNAGTQTLSVTAAQTANYAEARQTVSLTVNPANASAVYTGQTSVFTSSTTTTSAPVVLAATVTGTTPDIRTAKVNFIVQETGQTVCANLPVGLVSSGDQMVGTATCTATLDLGPADAKQYTIIVSVSGNYAATATDVVNVSKPLTESFITGGGYLSLTAASGQVGPRPGSRNNFGFNVKYNKSGTNLQGAVNIIVRSTDGKVYQIKSNRINSITTSPTTGLATFNGQASIQDITNPTAPIAVDGGATLQLSMTDKGEPGSADLIGITVWNKAGGVYFASNWNGTKAIEQTIAGGNLRVR